LSSGEAEFNGVVKAAGVALGYQSLLDDLGINLPVRVWTDSSAAIGICTRQGLGKLRRLDTHTLWVQQAVRQKRIDLRKVLGEKNPADIFTKHSLTRERLSKLVSQFACHFAGGRPESAPQLRTHESAKKTMAGTITGCDDDYSDNELCTVTQDDEPEMPHLVYDDDALEERFPPLKAVSDVEEESSEGEQDPLWIQGQRIAEEIREQTRRFGRTAHCVALLQELQLLATQQDEALARAEAVDYDDHNHRDC